MFVEVRYTTKDRTAGEAVLQAAVAAALEQVAQPLERRLDSANTRLESARAEATTAQAAVDALVAESGILYPDQSLLSAQRNLAEAQVQLSAAGDGASAGVAQRRVEGFRAEIDRLTPIVERYRTLLSESETVESEVDDSRRAAVDAQLELEDARSPAVVNDPITVRTGPAGAIRRRVASAAVVGFALAIAVLIVSILARRQTPYPLGPGDPGSNPKNEGGPTPTGLSQPPPPAPRFPQRPATRLPQPPPPDPSSPTLPASATPGVTPPDEPHRSVSGWGPPPT